MKKYHLEYNIGNVKYLVVYSDGVQTYSDGSLFQNIRCFHNIKKVNVFTKELDLQGYIFGS